MTKFFFLLLNVFVTFIGTFLLWSNFQSVISNVTLRIITLYIVTLVVSSMLSAFLVLTKKLSSTEAVGMSLLSAVAVGTILIGTAFDFRNF